MKLGRLNHIGVATPSIAESLRYYRDVMGASITHEPFDLEEQGVTVCFVDTPGENGTNGTQIELFDRSTEGRWCNASSIAAVGTATDALSSTMYRRSERSSSGASGSARHVVTMDHVARSFY